MVSILIFPFFVFSVSGIYQIGIVSKFQDNPLEDAPLDQSVLIGIFLICLLVCLGSLIWFYNVLRTQKLKVEQ